MFHLIQLSLSEASPQHQETIYLEPEVPGSQPDPPVALAEQETLPASEEELARSSNGSSGIASPKSPTSSLGPSASNHPLQKSMDNSVT